MDAQLRAGIAVYNAGEYHAAHDAWEDRWLDLEPDTDDERFLHGLIQFTAAIHHAQHGNWVGLRGLAESASAYLDDLPADYRGTNLGEVGAYLRRLAADPEHVERVAPPALTHERDRLLPADLDFEASSAAALVFAEEYGYDESTLERAVEFARADLDEDGTNEFVALVMDFARDGENRGLVFQRLEGHVARRLHREEDVEGLFE